MPRYRDTSSVHGPNPYFPAAVWDGPAVTQPSPSLPCWCSVDCTRARPFCGWQSEDSARFPVWQTIAISPAILSEACSRRTLWSQRSGCCANVCRRSEWVMVRSRRFASPMTTAWAAIALIALARIVYQVWFSPYELVADEAQYWDWSRRLSASYYSKGPGTAWLIALSTSVFGVSEWAVRLPATLAFVVTSAFVSRLAVDFSSRPAIAARAAFVAALL